MSKGRGVWVACYREMFDHPKTEEAARILVGDWPGGPPPWLESVSVPIVTAAILRLNLTLLDRLSENGRFRTPTPVKFLSITWPEYDPEGGGAMPAQVGAVLLGALARAGWVHEVGPRALKFHDFEVHNSKILGDRERKAAGRAKDAPRTVRGRSRADPAPTVTPIVTPIESPSETGGGGLPPHPPPTPQVPLAKIAEIWREVADRFQTKWIRHPKVPTGAPERAVRARWADLPDLGIWRLAMEAAAADDFWGGIAPGSNGKVWRANLESFARDKHFQKWVSVARETDWRLQGDEDLAFASWRATHPDLELLGYDGPNPDDGDLTPRESEQAEERLRKWWRNFRGRWGGAA